MQNKGGVKATKRALYYNHPNHKWRGLINAKQSFNKQKGAPKPTDMAAQSLKHIGMHNDSF